MITSSTAPVLGKRYRLGPLLGQGASGAVYEALDLMLGRTIAIKRMKLPDGVDARERANEFVTEAQTLARLDHPHIVDIHDVGLDDDGRPYFVMALVEQTLRDVLGERGALAIEQVLALLLPLCGALACAHDLGIIHCDLKPENIAVHRVGVGGLRGKLLDFSIARHDGGSEGDRTFVIGTPGYMAPEQIRGASCGPRTDVWALATVAFECLALRLPFEAETPTALLHRTVVDTPPSLATFAPSLPMPIVRTIDRALATNPDRRYADTREFAQALVSAAAQSTVRVPDEPDPIGLPEMHRWRSESLVSTAKLPTATQFEAPTAATSRATSPFSTTAIDTAARGQSASPRTGTARPLALGLLFAALLSLASWQAIDVLFPMQRAPAAPLARPLGAHTPAPLSRPASAPPPAATPRTREVTSSAASAQPNQAMPSESLDAAAGHALELHGPTTEQRQAPRITRSPGAARTDRATVDRRVPRAQQRAPETVQDVRPASRESSGTEPTQGAASAPVELEMKRDWEW